MTSDEAAEKAWDDWSARNFAPTFGHKRAFMAGRASRDAEVSALQRAKAENDERFMLERDEARAERDALWKMARTHYRKVRELREQLAAAEAVIENVRGVVIDVREADSELADFLEKEVLNAVPSTVLPDVIREAKAEALEEYANQWATRGMAATTTYVKERLRERAAEYRKDKRQ